LHDALEHDKGIHVNDKRTLRICRKQKIQSIVKGRYTCCTKPASDPAYVLNWKLNDAPLLKLNETKYLHI